MDSITSRTSNASTPTTVSYDSRPFTVLLILWCLFIVYGTTMPFDFSVPSHQLGARWDVAFGFPWPRSSITDFVSNIMLFIPWGFLFAALLAMRGRSLVTAISLAAIGAATLGFGVECLQLITPGRTPSAFDVISNTGGSIVGAPIGYVAIRKFWPRYRPVFFQLLQQRPWWMLACAVVMAMGFASLSPFDFTLDVSSIKGQIKSGRVIPFGKTLWGNPVADEPWDWLFESMMWMMAGGAFALAIVQSRRPAIWCAPLICGVVASLFEIVQIMVRSRMTDTTSVVFALIGATVGMTIIAAGRRRPTQFWIVPALIAWALTLVIARWTPPEFSFNSFGSFSTNRLIPFHAYYIRTDIFALADVLVESLSFVAFGALLAAWSKRTTIITACLTGAGIAFAMEFGQLFHAQRVGDLTDVIMSAIGAGLGWRLWRWIGSVRKTGES